MTNPAEPPLLKMSQLAKQGGVPAATIKHYLREGLIPAASVKTSRNMAYYDAGLIDRIRTIKDLQRERFLPLKVIRDVLEENGNRDEEVGEALRAALANLSSVPARSRDEIVSAGVSADELGFFERVGVITPKEVDGRVVYEGSDVALLRTLGAARQAGLTAEMLPYTILGPYVTAIRELSRLELVLFREGVLPLAGDRLKELVGAAAELSEQLIVLLRRRMLLPTLEALVREEGEKKPPSPEARGPAAKQPVSKTRAARARRKR